MSRRIVGIGEQILDQFEPEHATALVEFSKHLTQIDVDAAMFMARK